MDQGWCESLRIRNALDGKFVGADLQGQSIEERRASENANVTSLEGSAGEDDGHGLAGAAQAIGRDAIAPFGDGRGEGGARFCEEDAAVWGEAGDGLNREGDGESGAGQHEKGVEKHLDSI